MQSLSKEQKACLRARPLDADGTEMVALARQIVGHQDRQDRRGEKRPKEAADEDSDLELQGAAEARSLSSLSASSYSSLAQDPPFQSQSSQQSLASVSSSSTPPPLLKPSRTEVFKAPSPRRFSSDRVPPLADEPRRPTMALATDVIDALPPPFVFRPAHEGRQTVMVGYPAGTSPRSVENQSLQFVLDMPARSLVLVYSPYRELLLSDLFAVQGRNAWSARRLAVLTLPDGSVPARNHLRINVTTNFVELTIELLSSTTTTLEVSYQVDPKAM